MDKLNMQTTNIVDENIKKIGELFPNCLTERLVKTENSELRTEMAIDFDMLRQELSKDIVEGPEERYQFTWPDKRNAIRLANAPTTDTLRPCREESVDFDNTQNLYIEGDNLEVLKLLRENYLGKVKMIYIDPPYNTGNDFVYNDDFAQTTGDYIHNSGQEDEEGNRLVANTESNGRFHTDWLNMMYPRLKVAKDLLSEDGVILINMDENEITNLQKICSEIFGDSNDLGTIVWDKRNPKGDAKGISYQHEYILVYAKNIVELTTKCKLMRPKKNAKMMIAKANQLFAKVSSTYTLEQANNEFADWLASQKDLSGGERAYNRIDENGKVFRGVSMAWPNKKKAPDEYFIPLIHPITKKACPVPERGWRNPPQTMKQLLEEGMILFGKDETTQPNRKYILEENMFENIPSLIYFGGSDTAMLSQMGIPFDTPKVVDIVKEHIQSLSDNDSIILDFFSGSATTAHAVMQLNAEDGGNRKFIMVQLPEATDEKSEAYKAGYKNICEIGKERIRRAGKKILEEQKAKMSDFRQQTLDFSNENGEGLKSNVSNLKPIDVGFRVLKLDSSNMQDVYYSPEQFNENLLFEDNIKPDRTEEDLLFQAMIELGIKLSAKIESIEIEGKTVWKVDGKYLIACFDEKVNESTITEIARRKPKYFVMRDSSLATDNVADNFEQIWEEYSKETIRRII